MDDMAFIGFLIAGQYFAFDGHPTELYVRSDPTQVAAVAGVLAPTVNPENPGYVQVSEPASILQAELLTKGAYTTLFLGLGAVALLVGGVGIANIMVISVLERRSEIGLRRALGATRRHVAEQFLAEAILLSFLGGLAGTALGAAATAIYARTQHESLLIPPPRCTAESAPPWPSAPSPTCIPRAEPPACPQPKPCAPHDRSPTEALRTHGEKS
jgi:putative ABC transport system permease protein